MKIAISTLPFKTWSIDEVIKVCVDNGYDAIELRMDFHDWSDKFLPDSHFEELVKKVNDAGLVFSDLGSSVTRVNQYIAEDVANMRRLFEVANILGAKGVRIMLGNAHKLASAPKGPLEKDGIYKWLKEVDVIAGELGQQIWIETHNEYATGSMLNELFTANPELVNTKVIWDIIHPIEENETVEETMKLIYDKVVHLHIKDGVSWNDPEQLNYKYTKVGEGDMPIADIVAKVQAEGYDGYYSLEWESSWKAEIRDLNCDPEVIAGYPGLMRSFDTKKA
ncbi:MAG: sugar phosphate isomerase/epimerase [Clostridia bacterium]